MGMMIRRHKADKKPDEKKPVEKKPEPPVRRTRKTK